MNVEQARQAVLNGILEQVKIKTSQGESSLYLDSDTSDIIKDNLVKLGYLIEKRKVSEGFFNNREYTYLRLRW